MKDTQDFDAVIVTASRERWRIGRKFPAREPVTLPLNDLSEAEYRQLEEDPILSLRPGFADAQEGDDADQSDLILAAIRDLDPDKDFNQDGTPKVSAVSKILGRDVTKAEIAAVLDAKTKDA